MAEPLEQARALISAARKLGLPQEELTERLRKLRGESGPVRGGLPTEEAERLPDLDAFTASGESLLGGVQTGIGGLLESAGSLSRFTPPTAGGFLLRQLGKKVEPVGARIREGGLERRATAAATRETPLGAGVQQAIGVAGELGVELLPLEKVAKPLAALSRGTKAIDSPLLKSFDETFLAVPERVTTGQGVMGRVSSLAARLQEEFVNHFSGVERQFKRLVGERKFLAERGEEAAQFVRTAQANARSGLFRSTYNLNGEPTGEALDAVLVRLKKAGVEDYEFRSFITSQREVELARRAKQAGSKVEAPDAQLVDRARKAIREGVDKHGKVIVEEAQKFREWTIRAHLDPLVESGVISLPDRNKIIKSNRLFAPYERALDRLADEGVDLTFGARTGGAPVRGKFLRFGIREGKKVRDPLVEAADRALRIRLFTEKQNLRNLLGAAADSSDEVAKEVFRVEKASTGKTFRVYRDGELFHYAADPGAVRALESVSQKEAFLVLEWAKEIARTQNSIFRAAVTSLSPRFGIRNLGRDQLTLGINTRNGAVPFVSTAKTMVELAAGKKFTRQALSDFMASPAGHATFVSEDQWSLARSLAKTAEDAMVGRGKRVARKVRRNPLLPFQEFSNSLERASRFTEFKLARQKGKSIGRASLDASDVTLNFPRAGHFGRQWNSVEAFANAGIQDISKFVRNMKEKPVATTLRAAAYVTVPALTNWAKNRHDPDWQNLPEWEKMLFLHPVKLPNRRFVRMPVPNGIYGVLFSYLPQKLAEHMTSDGDPETARKLIDAFTQETPLRYTPARGVADSLAGTGEDVLQGAVVDPFLNLLPQVAQPVGEVIANRNPFFGRPVSSARDAGIDPEEEIREDTSGLAVQLGQGLGVSPVKLDHVIRGLSGELGRSAAKLFDPKRQGIRGPQDLPAIGGLVSTSPIGPGSEPVRRFYDLAGKVEQANETWRRQTTAEKADAYLKAHPEALYAKEVRAWRKELTGIWKNLADTSASRALSQAEKDDRILALHQDMTASALAALELVSDGVARERAGQ